eukprot:jgi/Chrzof1/5959/Cz16g21290.t1
MGSKRKKLGQILIKLVSQAGTGFFYVTKKNPRNVPYKLQRVKQLTNRVQVGDSSSNRAAAQQQQQQQHALGWLQQGLCYHVGRSLLINTQLC